MTARSSVAYYLAVFLLSSAAVIGLGTPPASASCSLSGDGNPNWTITANADPVLSNVHGQKASLTTGTPNLVQGPPGSEASTHIESIYIFSTASTYYEFGWAFDYRGSSTYGPYTFDAARYPGDTTQRYREGSVISSGDHGFSFYYENTDGKWHFKIDGVLQANQRTAFVTGGYPVAAGEINNSCNEGDGIFANLSRMKPDGTWKDWGGNDWFCDLEEFGGYDHLSPTRFGISGRSDSFTYPTDPPVPGSCPPPWS